MGKKREQKRDDATSATAAGGKGQDLRADEPTTDDLNSGQEEESWGIDHKDDYSYTQNREVSWLRFDDRVLDESYDETVPLFERLKFVSIFGSNLDEWFMIRIGGLSDIARLKHQPRDNKSNETPAEQIDNVLSMLPGLIRRQEAAFDEIESRLASSGLIRVGAEELTDADAAALARYFDQNVQPILSPMIVNPRHPFPNLRNAQLYVVCSLEGSFERGLRGLVEVQT